MTRPILSLMALFVALATPAVESAERALTADLVIHNATIVDVELGRAVPAQAIAIRGADIVAVGPESLAARWQSKQAIDARGGYVIPGLWDMHVHFGGGAALVDENKALLPLYVAHGITTVRDASGDLPDQVLSWRDEIAGGALFGPALLTSGPKIEGLNPIWKGTIEVGSRADVHAALARLKALRVDFVKITDNTLDPQLFLYALGQAKLMGLRTSAHIPMALTVEQAVDSGLNSIEHLDYAYKAGVRDQAAIAADFAAGRITREDVARRLDSGFDASTAITAYRRFAAQGVSVTPTMNGSHIIAWLDRDDHANDAYLAYIGPKLRATYAWRVERAAKADAAAIAMRHEHFERMASILPLLQQAGVTIMAGTDAGFLNSFNYPGIGLHEELAMFVRYGLTPAQALTTATRTGPAWFGKLDRFGAVAAGKAADLVLLSRNPLDDIAATRAIDAVVLRGRVYDRAALDAMLAEAKDRVARWDAEAR